MEPEAVRRLEAEFSQVSPNQLHYDLATLRRQLTKGRSRVEKITSQLHLCEQQIDFFTQESSRLLTSIQETADRLTEEQCEGLHSAGTPTSALLEVADKLMLLLGAKDRSWAGFRVKYRQAAAQECERLKEAMKSVDLVKLQEEQLTALLPIWKAHDNIARKLQPFPGACLLSDFLSLCVEFKLKSETLATFARKHPALERKLQAQQLANAQLSSQIAFAEEQIPSLQRALLSSREDSEVDERLSPDLTGFSIGSTDLSKAVVIEERTIGIAPFREGTATGGLLKIGSPRHSALPSTSFPNFETRDLYRERPPTEEEEFHIQYEDAGEVSQFCRSRFLCM